MTTGERMKARRKELGIPVQVIADALGVSVATVYRYEKGEIEKLPSSVLPTLAAVLHTTREYLMGWSEDKVSDSNNHELRSDPLIAFYGEVKDKLDDDDKADLMAFMRVKAQLKEQGKKK